MTVGFFLEEAVERIKWSDKPFDWAGRKARTPSMVRGALINFWPIPHVGMCHILLGADQFHWTPEATSSFDLPKPFMQPTVLYLILCIRYLPISLVICIYISFWVSIISLYLWLFAFLPFNYTANTV